MVRQITAVNILLGGVLLGLLATDGTALSQPTHEPVPSVRRAGEGAGRAPVKDGNAPNIMVFLNGVGQAGGRDAKGTDELKKECQAEGGIYLSTNGECINVAPRLTQSTD